MTLFGYIMSSKVSNERFSYFLLCLVFDVVLCMSDKCLSFLFNFVLSVPPTVVPFQQEGWFTMMKD